MRMFSNAPPDGGKGVSNLEFISPLNGLLPSEGGASATLLANLLEVLASRPAKAIPTESRVHGRFGGPGGGGWRPEGRWSPAT